ncbi:hypothetical protein RhiirA4_478312 [Rhizophagus irregularis]|uniref:Uncharacterized protein n=1 Tax=Rhizophagus irregularis TaxID=588596 RepID=A0A2I1HEQ0_9GLOM|nr:hypothetical protein RhiirA4_478312 [Rhizophagus irregularis]
MDHISDLQLRVNFSDFGDVGIFFCRSASLNELPTGIELSEFRTIVPVNQASQIPNGYDILAIVYRPDGKQLATSTLDGQIIFWDVENGIQTGTGRLSSQILDDMICTGRLSFRILDDMIGIIFEFWVGFSDDVIRTIHNGISETFRLCAGNDDSSMDGKGTGACDDKDKCETVVLL